MNTEPIGQTAALRAAIRTLYRERQAMVSVIEVLFTKLDEAKQEGKRQYDAGYHAGLRNVKLKKKRR